MTISSNVTLKTPPLVSLEGKQKKKKRKEEKKEKKRKEKKKEQEKAMKIRPTVP